MPSTRMNRFQSFTPLRESTQGSLRRLKTAFSPSRSSHSRSTSTSTTRTVNTVSPLTRNCSPASYRSSSAGSIMNALAIRQRPSFLEDEIEEEKLLFSNELDILEPRPSIGFGSLNSPELHVVGIFEVLDGRC